MIINRFDDFFNKLGSTQKIDETQATHLQNTGKFGDKILTTNQSNIQKSKQSYIKESNNNNDQFNEQSKNSIEVSQLSQLMNESNKKSIEIKTKKSAKEIKLPSPCISKNSNTSKYKDNSNAASIVNRIPNPNASSKRTTFYSHQSIESQILDNQSFQKNELEVLRSLKKSTNQSEDKLSRNPTIKASYDPVKSQSQNPIEISSFSKNTNQSNEKSWASRRSGKQISQKPSIPISKKELKGTKLYNQSNDFAQSLSESENMSYQSEKSQQTNITNYEKESYLRSQNPSISISSEGEQKIEDSQENYLKDSLNNNNSNEKYNFTKNQQTKIESSSKVTSQVYSNYGHHLDSPEVKEDKNMLESREGIDQFDIDDDNNSDILDETDKYSDEGYDSINDDPNFYKDKEKSSRIISGYGHYDNFKQPNHH